MAQNFNKNIMKTKIRIKMYLATAITLLCGVCALILANIGILSGLVIILFAATIIFAARVMVYVRMFNEL